MFLTNTSYDDALIVSKTTSSVNFLISGVLSDKQSIKGFMSGSISLFEIESQFSIKNFNSAVLISGLSAAIIFPIMLIIDSAPTACFQLSIVSSVQPLTNLSLSASAYKTGVITSFVYCLAPGPRALVILAINPRQVFNTFLFLSTSPALSAPNKSLRPFGYIL